MVIMNRKTIYVCKSNKYFLQTKHFANVFVIFSTKCIKSAYFLPILIVKIIFPSTFETHDRAEWREQTAKRQGRTAMRGKGKVNTMMENEGKVKSRGKKG